jgi:UPF0716 protein FxsA
MAVAVALAFIFVPIIEIAVLIQVGGLIGVWQTIALVVITAVVGAAMLRAQGLRTLQAAQESLNRNEMPVAELFDGACLLVAGILLLTPGFVTDAFGFLLFVPPVRRLARGLLWRWLSTRRGTTIRVDGVIIDEDRDAGPRGPGAGGGQTIEGDWRRIDNGGHDDEDGGGKSDDDGRGGTSRWGRR